MLNEAGWRCKTCGRAGRLDVDHIVPMSDGGSTWDPDNLQSVCRGCHFAKTAQENRRRKVVSPEALDWDKLVAEMVKDSA